MPCLSLRQSIILSDDRLQRYAHTCAYIQTFRPRPPPARLDTTRHDDGGAPLLTRADAASRHCRADSVPACSSVLRPIQKPKLPTHIQEQPHPTHCLALCLRSSDRPLDPHPWSFLPSPPARLTSFVSAACRGLSTVSSALQLPLQVQAYGSKASRYLSGPLPQCQPPCCPAPWQPSRSPAHLVQRNVPSLASRLSLNSAARPSTPRRCAVAPVRRCPTPAVVCATANRPVAAISLFLVPSPPALHHPLPASLTGFEAPTARLLSLALRPTSHCAGLTSLDHPTHPLRNTPIGIPCLHHFDRHPRPYTSNSVFFEQAPRRV